jgi:CheY-like chemotaxis protein
MENKPLNKILYVEDEPDIQTVALMALETIGGFTVQACSSGQEAIEAAPAFAPDLVILDVMMPGIDGPATMEALRKLPATADVDIIFMTAKVQSHEVERYIEMGAVDVIAKPFDPMTLAAQVQAVWDRQQEDPDTPACRSA